jgi:hypothetical protein
VNGELMCDVSYDINCESDCAKGTECHLLSYSTSDVKVTRVIVIGHVCTRFLHDRRRAACGVCSQAGFTCEKCVNGEPSLVRSACVQMDGCWMVACSGCSCAVFICECLNYCVACDGKIMWFACVICCTNNCVAMCYKGRHGEPTGIGTGIPLSLTVYIV